MEMADSGTTASFESESSIETYGELGNDSDGGDNIYHCDSNKVSLLNILLVETQENENKHQNGLEDHPTGNENHQPSRNMSKRPCRQQVIFSSRRSTSWRSSHSSLSEGDVGEGCFMEQENGYEEEMKRIEEFIEKHHASRKDMVADHVESDDALVNDYQNFITANAASPNAIYATTTYAIQTDDMELLDILLRDIGIEYILRHCYMMDGSFLENEGNKNKTDFNMFWVASYFGSAKVLQLLAEECLVYFEEKSIEKMTELRNDDNVEHDENDEINVMKEARDALATILDKPTSKWDSTSLYIAVVQNHPEVIRALLQYGVDANRMNKEGYTPAIIASSLNNTEALIALGESNIVDLNLSNHKCMNPVLTASTHGHVEVLKILHNYKRNGVEHVDFKCKDANGFGCVSLAAKYNHHKVITFFCKIQNPTSSNGVNINQRHLQDDETALHIATRHNRPQVVRAFFESIPCHCDAVAKNKNNMTALHIAANLNFPQVIMEVSKRLSRETLDLLDVLDDFGCSPLYIACSKGYLDVVKLLAPISNLSRTCRIQYKKKSKAKDLKDDKSKIVAKPSQYKIQPPLVIASIKGHLDIVSVLLACGAEVDQTDDTGHTSLIHASKIGHLDIVMELISGGADPRAKSKKGFRTPLQKAKKYKHNEIVKFLEANGG